MSRFLKAVCITKPMHSYSLLRDYQKLTQPSVLYLLLSLRVSPTPNTPTFRSPCWPCFVPWSHPDPSQGLFCAVLPALSYTISHFHQNANTWNTDLPSVSTWPLGLPHSSPTLYSEPLIKLWIHLWMCRHHIPGSHSSAVLSPPSHENGSYQGPQDPKMPIIPLIL